METTVFHVVNLDIQNNTNHKVRWECVTLRGECKK